jgi:hypothetical protein
MPLAMRARAAWLRVSMMHLFRNAIRVVWGATLSTNCHKLTQRLCWLYLLGRPCIRKTSKLSGVEPVALFVMKIKTRLTGN